MIDGGVEYKIEKYVITVQLVAASYSSIGMLSPFDNLKMGVMSNNISLNSQCSVGAINNSTKNSYF